MYQKVLLPLLLALIMFPGYNMKAQNLVIDLKNGTEQTELLSSIKTITFNSGNMVLNFKAGTTQPYAVTSVDKVVFNGVASGIEETSTSAVDLKYIASNATLVVEGLSETHQNLSIWNINGSVVMQQTITGSEATICVSELQVGFYLVKVNSQVLKFVKR